MRLALAGLLALGACAPADSDERPDGGGSGGGDALSELESPAFDDRVAARIAELEAAVATAVAGSADSREPEDGELPALVDMISSRHGRMREAALSEARAFGDAALPELVAMNADESLGDEVRNSALHLAFGIGTPASLEAVVAVLEGASEPWRRRYAAWLLGQTEEDRFVLRMILPLRYEKDDETVVWLVEALARHGNYAGLEAVAALARGSGPAAELAAGKLVEITARANGGPDGGGGGAGVADAAELIELWGSARAHERLTREPSDALRLAAWRELAELSSERFQLRGVDDARFVLCRTGPWGARLVAEALSDRDPYVRLHADQVLERMGARARPVVGALHPLLADPRTAHAVAEALGAIGAPESMPLLLAALAPGRSHELRVGAAHGLGRLGDAERVGDPAIERAATALRSLSEGEDTPEDLRLAAASALLSCADDPDAARLLARGMGAEGAVAGDPQGCEVMLERWIVERAGADEEGFGDLLETWRTLDERPALLRTAEDTRARLDARSALVLDFLEPEP